MDQSIHTHKSMPRSYYEDNHGDKIIHIDEDDDHEVMKRARRDAETMREAQETLNYFKYIFFGGFICLVFTLIYMSIQVVPAGHVGVRSSFGEVSDTLLQPGIHMTYPWVNIIPLNIQTQIIAMSEDVPSKEGLAVHLEAAVLFRLSPDHAISMYREVGISYVDKLVTPQFRSVLRSVTSGHEAKDLYSALARTSMTEALTDELKQLLNPRGLVVESTPLKNLLLPQALQDAIQEKLKAEQESLKMEFILQKETQEAQRKTIEAEGIQRYQSIIKQGIDENILRWKGLEVTERLSNSPNSKMIFMGSGNTDGLPILLNQ